MTPIVKSFLSVSAAYLLGEPRDPAAERAAQALGGRDAWPARPRFAPPEERVPARRDRASTNSAWAKGRLL
jgi:hypothetical protein